MKKLFIYTLACCISTCFFASCSKDVKSPVSASNATVKINTPAQNPSQAPAADNSDHSGGCHSANPHSGS